MEGGKEREMVNERGDGGGKEGKGMNGRRREREREMQRLREERFSKKMETERLVEGV